METRGTDVLTVLVATLTERLDTARRDIETITVRCTKAEDGSGEIRPQLAVIEERFNEMKKGLEESSRRKAAILPLLPAGCVGGGCSPLLASC